jgi:hypothetical protein
MHHCAMMHVYGRVLLAYRIGVLRTCQLTGTTRGNTVDSERLLARWAPNGYWPGGGWSAAVIIARMIGPAMVAP